MLVDNRIGEDLDRNTIGSWFPSPIPDKGTSKLATSFLSKHQLTWGWPHFNDVWKVGHCNPLGEVDMRCYWSIELLTLRLTTNIHAYSLSSNKMWYANVMRASEFQGQATATVSRCLRIYRNLKNIWRHVILSLITPTGLPYWPNWLHVQWKGRLWEVLGQNRHHPMWTDRG